MKEVKIKCLHTCSRCGQDHVDIVFKPISNPAPDFTHWAMCPVTGEPIVMFQAEQGNADN